MASQEFSGPDADGALARDTVPALIVGSLTGALSILVVIHLGIELGIPLLSFPLIVGVLVAVALIAVYTFASPSPCGVR
jgi:hypothetical protein